MFRNYFWLLVVFVFAAAMALQVRGEDPEPPKAESSAGGAKVTVGGNGQAVGGGDDYITEKRSDGTTVKYKKKTSYDFEGANIDGIYNKPAGSYISNIKDVKAKSIIRIRENFDAEVTDSARLLK
jgi:hypothetical protein